MLLPVAPQKKLLTVDQAICVWLIPELWLSFCSVSHLFSMQSVKAERLQRGKQSRGTWPLEHLTFGVYLNNKTETETSSIETEGQSGANHHFLLSEGFSGLSSSVDLVNFNFTNCLFADIWCAGTSQHSEVNQSAVFCFIEEIWIFFSGSQKPTPSAAWVCGQQHGCGGFFVQLGGVQWNVIRMPTHCTARIAHEVRLCGSAWARAQTCFCPHMF